MVSLSKCGLDGGSEKVLQNLTLTGQNVKFTKQDSGGIMRAYFRSEHFR